MKNVHPNTDHIELPSLARRLAGLSGAEWKELLQLARGHSSEPYIMRQNIINAARECLPKGAPGRKRKILATDFPRLLTRAEQLRPALRAVLRACTARKKQSLVEAIKYVAPDYPEECNFLSRYLRNLESILQDEPLLMQVATPESGVRLLGDALAGAEFDLKPRYSIQCVREARRTVTKTGRQTAIAAENAG